MQEPRLTVATDTPVLASLRGEGRIWAVASVHGEVAHLRALHRRLERLIVPGDQLVYLGGYLGYGDAVAQTVDELLLFRRAFIARPGVEVDDVVFLRGAQEEMWQKLLQLQFSSKPDEVLQWMVDHGIATTISAYGGSLAEGFEAAEDGVLALTRWTGGLRQAMREMDGHNALMVNLRHAAAAREAGLLFVHAGLDPTQPLSAQLDHFWWGSRAFDSLDEPYEGFRRVVRGHAPHAGGFDAGAVVVTLDAGCGSGGPLVAACFDQAGEMIQVVEG